MKRLQIASISAVAALGLWAGAAAAADKLTVVSWGGAYSMSQVKAYHEPYKAKKGIEILAENYNGGLAEIKAQVEAGKVTWDVVDLELSDVVRGCDEGLLEELDLSGLPPAPDGTPAKKDFIAGTLHECGVATILWSTIYAYDASRMAGGKPKTIADFFDTKKFPGKRGMRKTPKVNLEFALMADGVPAGKVYEVLSTPAGVDRAFAKLDTIKDHVVWWETGSQPPQLLADGEVALTTAYNGRIFDAAATEKKAFVIVWDGQVWDIDLWGIPKGSPNKAAAVEFIKFSTDTQRLADQASYISYGPARRSSVSMIGKHFEAGIPMGPHMPTAPGNFKNALQNNFEFWADYQDELNERFNAWLAK